MPFKRLTSPFSRRPSSAASSSSSCPAPTADCPGCGRSYDTGKRRPLAADCGHVSCRACVRDRHRKCAVCACALEQQRGRATAMADIITTSGSATRTGKSTFVYLRVVAALGRRILVDFLSIVIHASVGEIFVRKIQKLHHRPNNNLSLLMLLRILFWNLCALTEQGLCILHVPYNLKLSLLGA